MDYAQNFYVCPYILEDNEKIEKYRDYILEAVKYPNMLNGVRRIVISEDEYTLFGLVCDLCEFIKEKEDEENYLKYTKDEKGRNILAFIGVLVKNTNCQKNDIISDFDQVVFELFKDYIADEKKWFEKKINHYVVDSKKIKTQKFVGGKDGYTRIKCYGRDIFLSTPESDKKIFTKIMSKCCEKNIRFCSNYYGIDTLKTSLFHTVTSKYIDKIQQCYEDDIAEKKNAEIKQKQFFPQKINRTEIIIILVIIFILFIIVLIEMES